MSTYEDILADARIAKFEATHKGTCDTCGHEYYLEDLIETQDGELVCHDCVIYCETCGAQWGHPDNLYYDEETGTTCELCKE